MHIDFKKLKKLPRIRTIFSCLILFILISCNANPKEYSAADLIRIEEIKDSMRDNMEKKMADVVFGDTIGVNSSPIQIKSFRIVESESGHYRNVKSTYKNISNKNITAIRFRWKGVDAFGEPADLGNSFAEGYGGGFTDDILKPGKTDSGVWDILSRDAKKLTLAWPTEAMFEDGTKWKLKENE